ncbi:MAG: hemerythrin domain-containing protein [Mongoliitalea sp.]
MSDHLSNSQHKPIKDLVEENYVFAAVLHYFGIDFFLYEHNSLDEVCKKFKINPQQLITELEYWALRKEPSHEELYLKPIEVLMAYLKRKHYFFVRQELPFLSNMIGGIQVDGNYAGILADLKMLFPMFVEDFIHHIHEEETTLFNRIKLLQEIEADLYRLPDALKILENKPIANLSDQHEAHDDEMIGIRQLTKDYQLEEASPTAIKVLYHELQVFEKELQVHATIEDTLLFPKAIELEREVVRRLRKKIISN